MSKLREAAQAAVEAFDLHGYSPLTIRAIWALRDALAEDRLAEYMPPEEEPVSLFVRVDDYEYEKWGDVELWGVVTGGLGVRQVVHQINPNEVWPVGTALYVRRAKK